MGQKQPYAIGETERDAAAGRDRPGAVRDSSTLGGVARTLSNAHLVGIGHRPAARGVVGLRWEDIDSNEAEIRVVRSIVDQVEGPPKTLASRRPIPLSTELASALEGLRQQSDYTKPGDWVFASPQAVGMKLTSQMLY